MTDANYPILITPSQYQRSKSNELENRKLRDQSIANMRRSDPEYWTFQRLADHWGMTKQNIDAILQREGVK